MKKWGFNRSEKKEIVMNGAGVAELGFPGWPQFDPKSKAEIAGGIILILIGTKILLEHLGVINF